MIPYTEWIGGWSDVNDATIDGPQSFTLGSTASRIQAGSIGGPSGDFVFYAVFDSADIGKTIRLAYFDSTASSWNTGSDITIDSNGRAERLISTGSNVIGNVSFYGTSTSQSFTLKYCQFEAGSYPTSYIPNHSGGSVTRGAETIARMTLPESLGTDFTIYFDTKVFDSGNGLLIFEDSSNNEIYKFYSYSDHYDVYDVTAGQFLVKTTAPANGKIALKQSGSSIKIFINGQDETKTGAVGNTTEIANFRIHQTSVQQNRCTLDQMLLFTEALSDADCITLTTL